MPPAPSPTYERLRDDVTRRMRMRPIERVKRTVGKVLTGKEPSATERDKLLQLCRQRLDGFREQRGEVLAPPSPGSRAARAS